MSLCKCNFTSSLIFVSTIQPNILDALLCAYPFREVVLNRKTFGFEGFTCNALALNHLSKALPLAASPERYLGNLNNCVRVFYDNYYGYIRVKFVHIILKFLLNMILNIGPKPDPCGTPLAATSKTNCCQLPKSEFKGSRLLFLTP